MDYSTQTVAQLKDILKSKGLSTEGKKADLVARLNEQEQPVQEEIKEDPKTEEPENEQSKPEQESTLTVIQPQPKEETKEEPKEEPKKLTPEERKTLAIELLNKKIQRAEKFNDEEAVNQAKKDLIRVEKFGVELGTSLARELGLVNNQLKDGFRNNKGKFKPTYHKKFHKKRY
ncbi:unnamed protein product [Candida verbasci]|uniref:SAP domain-containing protein n=1 Tax=Candida verbasci TaxID=1227364 RepID=A0A9W4TXA2_9ASCO|nr:unnamed protein product [Candida verbasci]